MRDEGCMLDLLLWGAGHRLPAVRCCAARPPRRFASALVPPRKSGSRASPQLTPTSANGASQEV
jgi:hypothetical protein